MFGLHIKFVDGTAKVIKASDKAAFRNMGHAAASIRITAIESVEFTREIVGYYTAMTRKGPRTITIYRPSEPGTPVHSHHSRMFFRQAIRFDVSKTDAVVGPAESIIGDIMSAHEFGKEYKGFDYDPRPVLAPALEANLDRFVAEWKHSITE
jgi:hypothetical protein